MKNKIKILVLLIVLLQTACLEPTYCQVIKNTDTLSQNDKKIINIVFNVNTQMEETIKNLDTLNTLKKLVIMEKDKQLKAKDTLINIRDRQLETTTKQIVNLQKENKSLNLYKNILWVTVPIIIIETLILLK